MAYSRGIKIEDEITERIEDAAAAYVHENGVERLTVRKLLQILDVSNRVFYNRFQSLDELLESIYKKQVLEMRKALPDIREYDDGDLFDLYLDVLTNVLRKTYDQKKQFSQYMFAHDALSEENRKWWIESISGILRAGIERDVVRKDLDVDAVSYAIWCFSRGFNADAVNRMSQEEAVTLFRSSMSFFLDGIKKQK